MAQEEELIRRELQDPTTFCNSFWGFNDAGYPVIQSRMKGSARVMEDIRAMYKERADIEAEYSKRLQKLSKQAIGRDETGMMRQALEVVRAEIEQTAKTHADLGAVFRKDLEGQLSDFSNRVQSQRKGPLSNIEKLYKQKTTQESYVNKSKDKYEQDCIKINGYTAQSSLVQGRDLEKVTSKLDKAQSTVSNNDKDYQNFVRALRDTTLRWNSEWKAYLDQCQDIEEERLDFLKSNLWNYANAISAVCVSDDQSCERVRVSLENCEAPRDIVEFVQRAGTGNAIPDPPEYINYARGQPPPPRPTYKSANFQRTTVRPPTFVQPLVAPDAVSAKSAGNEAPPPSDGFRAPPENVQQSVSSGQNVLPASTSMQGSTALPDMEPHVSNPATLPAVPKPQQAADQSFGTPSREAKTDKRMSAKSFLANTPSKGAIQDSPQQRQPNHPPGVLPPSDTNTSSSANTDDPIAKALAELRMKPSRSPVPSGAPAPPSKNEYHPSEVPQPTSPGGTQHGYTPSAAFMQAPERAKSPMPVEEVLGQYGQSFPGERRSLSRQNSSASRHSRTSMQQAPDRARSPDPSSMEPSNSAPGFAGVGARGRSPSPQPFQQRGPPASQPALHHAQPSGQSQPRPSASTHTVPQRSKSPLGISLDASGTVTHDQMADEFIKRSTSTGPQQHRPASGNPQYTAQSQNSPYTQPGVPPGQHSQYAGPAPGAPHTPISQHVQHAPASQHTPVSHHAAVSQHTPVSPHTVSQYQYGQQQSTPQSHHSYVNAGQQAAVQTPPHQPHHQDSMGSIGRQFAGFTSPYNQRPASATAPTPQPVHPQSGTPQPAHAPSQAGYTQYNQQPANAYTHHYQQPYQHPSGVPAGGPPQQYQTTQPYQAQPQHPPYGQGSQSQWPSQPQQPPRNAGYAPEASAPPPQVQTQHHAPQARPATSQTPAPPTGQFSDTGKPILFYVKALYDYQAQLDEEFSFTAGDVIAVWETSPDGWWQGELLDDARRRSGANTFPSNFVSLLN